MVEEDLDNLEMFLSCSTRLLRLFRRPVLFRQPKPAPAGIYASLVFQACPGLTIRILEVKYEVGA